MVVKKYGLGFNTIRTFTDQQKWRLLNMVEYVDLIQNYETENTETMIYSQTTNVNTGSKYLKSPRIQFKCFANRRPFYYYANAYSLIFLITVITLGTFGIDSKSPQFRLNTTATIFLTSVSFKWVINRNLPAVCYITSLDAYSILSIVFIILVYSWHSLVGAFPDALVPIDQWLLLAFSCLFILFQLLFVVRGYRSYSKVLYYENKEKAYFLRSKNM